jgi:hypothetical protein
MAASGGERERERVLLRQCAVRTHQVGLIATGPTRGDAWAASAWAGVDGWMNGWMDGDGGRGENSGSRSIL